MKLCFHFCFFSCTGGSEQSQRLHIYKQIMTSLDNSIKLTENHKSIKIHYRKHLLKLESETLKSEYSMYLNTFKHVIDPAFPLYSAVKHFSHVTNEIPWTLWSLHWSGLVFKNKLKIELYVWMPICHIFFFFFKPLIILEQWQGIPL